MSTVKGSSFYKTPDGELNKEFTAKISGPLKEELIKKYAAQHESGLIMGYGDGWLADYFKGTFSRLIIVEGSKTLTDRAAESFRDSSHIAAHHSYFENFELPPEDRVDVILGTHVLEHVDNPVEVLTQSREWLADGGVAIFSVPNAKSLHRRIGVKLGMLKTEYELNEGDTWQGHQRVYDPDSLVKDAEGAGYHIIASGGYNVKLVSQKQMESWSPELIQAVADISRECPPDICADLFIVCKN